MPALWSQLQAAAAGGPGLALCVCVAAFAFGMSLWGGGAVVWALLIGMLLTACWSPPHLFSAGLEMAAKPILRIGVALLGTQISAATIQALDTATITMLACSIPVILISGLLLAQIIGIERELALIAAASVAICGASAAVAFALVLARPDTRERDAACTVGAISLLSTAAMLIYPPLTQAFGFDATAAGVFLGGTIQEVPHAVAAGYGLDPVVGNIATVTKLLRVALLGPALILVASTASGKDSQRPAPSLHVPPFLLAFIALAGLNVAGILPRALGDAAGATSRSFIIVAMAAIGLRLQWRSIVSYGWRPVLLLVILSSFLVLLIAIYVSYAHL